MKKIFLFFCYSLFFSSCSLYQFENEPNDTIASLNKFYSIPTYIKGSFSSPDDIDIFPVLISHSSYYSFGLSSIKGLDTTLFILDGHSHLIIKSNDNYKNFGENVPSLYLNKGVYFIAVKLNITKNEMLFNKRNSYTLLIENYPPPKLIYKNFSLERKPNSSFSNIQSVFDGVPMIGYYSPSINALPKTAGVQKLAQYLSTVSQKDFTPYTISLYSFYYKKRGSFLFNLSLSKVNDFDPLVAIFDVPFMSSLIKDPNIKAGDAIIQDDNFYDEGESVTNYLIQGQKQYIIAVVARNRLNYMPLNDMIDKYYQMRITVNKPSGILEKEPNDIISQANPLNSNLIKGTLDSLQDKDFFELPKNVLKKETIFTYATIHLSPVDKSSPVAFDIYNQNGEIIKSVPYMASIKAALIDNLALDPQIRYYIVVKFMEGANINISRNVEYELSFTTHQVKIPSNLELEPNDYDYFTSKILQDTNTLHLNQSFAGFMNNKGDIDKLFFVAPATGLYYLTISHFLPDSSILIRLYRDNSVLIKTEKSKFLNKDYTISQYLKKGDLLKIVLSATNPTSFSETSPYFVTITSRE